MYEYLEQPLVINRLQLMNRLIMPPMATRLTGTDGVVNEPICRYYRERAAGGYLGLIIVEHSFVDKQGRSNPVQMGLAGDEFIPGYRHLVEEIHAEGVPVFAQINHAGSFTTTAVTGQELVSASAVEHPKMAGKGELLPRALTREEIAALVKKYAAAAARAKAASCDGVEVHCAHGYLLNQFYSPLTNKREDEYGPQSLENRLRFACEVLQAVREAVGKDYPICFRLGAGDYLPGGSSVEDAAAAGPLLEAAGIDFLSVTGGMCGYIREDHKEPGYFRELSLAMKQNVSVPVLLAGGVTELSQAEELLADGFADAIGVGRALLKDAAWAKDQFEKA